MDLMRTLQERASAKRPRVVYPEALDQKIVEAGIVAKRLGIADPVFIGDPKAVAAFGLDVSGVDIIDPSTNPEMVAAYAEALSERTGFSEKAALRRVAKPLDFGAMMVAQGDASGMVAGLVHATEDVILSSQLCIGLAAGVSVPSSFFIMDVPGWLGGEDGLIMFADCAVVPNPSAVELASIALSSAVSARGLLDWEPRVALLSFSTKGSATHSDVDKVLVALELARNADSGLLIDGELQVDAAVVPEVANRKIKDGGVLEGRANILVFPDLDAGNAGYKLVQRLAGAAAYGPVLQGFARPVSDLSRGATVEDIIGATTIVAAQA